MSNISLILLAAGESSRFGLPSKKQWLYQDETPLWLFVAETFLNLYDFSQIVIVGNAQELKLMKSFAEFVFVNGGKTRQESLKNALQAVDSDYVLVNDVARCCIDSKMLNRLLSNKKECACVVPTLKVSDTTYYNGKPIDREKLLRVQTPQLSDVKTLKNLLENAKEFTDESSLFYNNNKEVIFVEGSKRAEKLTYKEDLQTLPCLKKPATTFKTGFGIDIHPFEEGKEIDALLGASSLGDIGELFPDNDIKYKNADSRELLKEVIKLVKGVGYEIIHCDLSILAQVPKISPYKELMRKALASIMEIRENQINIKATTGEKLGFVGRKEGVAVKAIVTLNYYRWDR